MSEQDIIKHARLLAAVKRMTSVENPTLYAHLEAALGADRVPSYPEVLRVLCPQPNKSTVQIEVDLVKALGEYLVEVGHLLVGRTGVPA